MKERLLIALAEEFKITFLFIFVFGNLILNFQSAFSQNRAINCVDFESQAFGAQFGFNAGNSEGEVIFIENNIPVSVDSFTTGIGSSFGSSQIDTAFSGFAIGQTMRTDNINLVFDFTNLGFLVNRVTFEFADLGGSENVAVNDELILAGELITAPTDIAPGVTLTIQTAPLPGGGQSGRATLVGRINFLRIGGQEFWIDNVCAEDTTTPQEHLFISELCVRPRLGEFVEIYNPSKTEAVDLTHYYLTDNVNDNGNDYTRLVQGRDSLTVAPGDFFVKFPNDARIGPGEFQTIAFSATNFSRRYQAQPTYEIIDTDNNVANNMEIQKLGEPPVGFDDPNEVVILLYWNEEDSSDLVQDVDYVVWGQFLPPIPGPIAKPLSADAGEQPEARVATGPLNEAVDKTGLSIDGIDSDDIPSIYRDDTAALEQRAVASQAHEFLKSWQRRPGITGPREFGELTTGGNGISGHDETSENLSIAFREETPTPGSGFSESDNQLDVEIDTTIVTEVTTVGLPNGFVNPGEEIDLVISLLNTGPLPTGDLFAVVRPLNPFATMSDSTALFSSIEPGASAFALDSFAFSVARDSLPDSLAFELRVVQKIPGKSQSIAAVKQVIIVFNVDVSNIIFDMTFSCVVEPIAQDTSNLRIDYTITNTGTADANGLRVQVSDRGPNTVIETVITNGIIFLASQLSKNGTIQPSPLRFGMTDAFNGEASFFTLRFSWIEDGDPLNFETPPFNCSMLNTFEVSGQITYYKDQTPAVLTPIANAMVTYQTQTASGFTHTETTDANGNYSFQLQASDAAGEATIFVVMNDSVPVDAITTSDLEAAMGLTMCATSQMCEFDTAYQFIAADINGDSSVDGTDDDLMLLMKKVCCPNNEVWPAAQNWIFVNARFPIDTTNWQMAPRFIQFNFGHYDMHLDFVALVRGDVDGNLCGTDVPPAGCTACDGSGETSTKTLLPRNDF